ncbi:MAG: hypothetical protein AAF927_20685 [Bacteroidota bacterium]
MIYIQSAFLIFSFTFFAPVEPPVIGPELASNQPLMSGLAEIEAEQCFHEINEQYVKSALAHSNSQAYSSLDMLSQKSDGFQSESLSTILGHLFHEDTEDFLDYYLSQSSTDFQFLFLSELEINCELQSEAEVQNLKKGWLAKINATEVADTKSEALATLLYQIENL